MTADLPSAAAVHCAAVDAAPVAPPKWEVVREGTYRLPVPGGWIYNVPCDRDGAGGGVCFVPAPQPQPAPRSRR